MFKEWAELCQKAVECLQRARSMSREDAIRAVMLVVHPDDQKELCRQLLTWKKNKLMEAMLSNQMDFDERAVLNENFVNERKPGLKTPLINKPIMAAAIAANRMKYMGSMFGGFFSPYGEKGNKDKGGSKGKAKRFGGSYRDSNPNDARPSSSKSFQKPRNGGNSRPKSFGKNNNTKKPKVKVIGNSLFLLFILSIFIQFSFNVLNFQSTSFLLI